MQVAEVNLEQYKWDPNNTSASVNPVLADYIAPIPAGNSLGISIYSSKAYGGALCSLKRAIPLVNGLPPQYYLASWFVNPSQIAAKLSRLYELDTIFIFPPAPNSSTKVKQWYNGSAQLNLSEGGMWQIDTVKSTNPDGSVVYGWTDTGFKPGPLPPDVWTNIKIWYKLDYVKQTSQVLKIQQNVQSMDITDPKFVIPANLNNWSLYVGGVPYPMISQQAQLCLDVTPGAFEVYYQLNGYWSDQPQ